MGNGVCGFPGSASSRLEQLVRIEQDGDGAVVFRGDKHIGAEPAVLRLKAAAAALLQDCSYSGTACSGRAAPVKLGRLPLRQSA